MTPTRPAFMLLPAAMLLLPLVAGCNRVSQPSPATPPAAPSTASTTPPQTALGRIVDQGMRRVRAQLENGNLDLTNVIRINAGQSKRAFDIAGASAAPSAAITPQGDLLVAGKPVAVTASQRALLLGYRRQIIAIAETGMAMGVEGADLAGKAVLEAVRGVIQGNPGAAGKKIEAEGQKLADTAKQICRELPALRATQQALVTSLPAFKPYATMTQADIDDCSKGDGASVTSR